jgi:hypothetical protein
VFFVAAAAIIVGAVLMYAGLKRGETWRQPWSPFVTHLAPSS